MLDAPQGAGAAHAGLHLVGDEKHAPLVADLADLGEEVVGRHAGAGLALHGLGDEGGDVEADGVADLELLVERVGVAVGDEAHVGRQRVEGLAPGGLAGHAQAAERLAVEAAQAADDAVGVVGLLALGVQLGELERALVGLGAGVAEEGVLQVARE